MDNIAETLIRGIKRLFTASIVSLFDALFLMLIWNGYERFRSIIELSYFECYLVSLFLITTVNVGRNECAGQE